MSVSVAIMAHPKRAAFIPELETKLDRPAKVVWDERSDRWDTGRRSMLAYDPAATHHLVVQDDAVIPRDLVAGVEKAIKHTPGDVPLCLYVGKVRPYREMVREYTRRAENGASWLVMDELVWGVAIVMPTKFIEPMVAWCDGQRIPNYDRRMSAWLESKGIETWYPWPSLVDHRESPSLVPGRGHAGRIAHKFVGTDASALDVDYSGAVLRLPNVSDYRRPGGPPMLFKCDKYDDYYLPNLQIQFVDGFAEVTSRSAISYLNGVFMRRRGIRPATEAEESAWRASKDGEAPAPNGVMAPETPGGDPGHDGNEVPHGTADEVLAWVGDDTERALAAIDAESQREKPRKTLLAKLDTVGG